MQTQNRFLDFAEEVMARHKGFGFGYDPISMIYLEDGAPQEPEQPVRQDIVTNLYHIQNIREENYLYQQNLTFLTQILEKRLYQKLYPSVEQQIERVIREEMPETEERIVREFSQQLCRLVERGGIEQFRIIRDRMLKEYHETETKISREQEVLFRKIENIWNSSVYGADVYQNHMEVTANYRNYTQNVYDRSYTHNTYGQNTYDRTQSFLERSMSFLERQEKMLSSEKPESVGNLGQLYLRETESSRELFLQNHTETDRSRELLRENIQKQLTQHIESAELTYLEEPGTQEKEEKASAERERTVDRMVVQPEVHLLESQIEDIRQIHTETESSRELLLQNHTETESSQELLLQNHTETDHSRELLREDIQKQLIRHTESAELTYLEEPGTQEKEEKASAEREHTIDRMVVQPEVHLLESQLEDIRQILTETESSRELLLQNYTETERSRELLQENIQKQLTRHTESAELMYLEESVTPENGEKGVTEQEHTADRMVVQPEVHLLESQMEDIRQNHTETESSREQLLQNHTETESSRELLRENIQKQLTRHTESTELTYLEEPVTPEKEEKASAEREHTIDRMVVQPEVHLLESQIEDIRQIHTETESSREQLFQNHTETERSRELLQENIQKQFTRHTESAELTYLEESVTQEKEEKSSAEREHTVDRMVVQPEVHLLESQIEDIRQIHTETDRSREQLFQNHTETDHSRELLQENIQKQLTQHTESAELTYLEEPVTQEKEEKAPAEREHTIDRMVVQPEVHLLESRLEDIRQIHPEAMYKMAGDFTVLFHPEAAAVQTHTHTDTVHLEYHSEETEQTMQEMEQLIRTEMVRIPEFLSSGQPETMGKKSLEQRTSEQTAAAGVLSPVEHQRRLERSRSVAEQILLRMEKSGTITTAITTSTAALAARPVALQQLSRVILEYEDSHLTVEELYTNMTQILSMYRKNSIRQIQSVTKMLQIDESGAALQPGKKDIELSAYKPGKQQFTAVLEPAAILYRSEEDSSEQQERRTDRLEQQVKEVVKNLKTVEEKTVVHREALIEQQKTVVREMLKNSSGIWMNGEGTGYIQKEVQQSIEEQLDQNVDQIVRKVYRRLEDRLRVERGRRGLI